MRKKIKLFIMTLVAVMAGGVMTLAVAEVSAGKCPAGSKNSSYSKSIAECNTEKTTDNNSLLGRVRIIINVVLGVLGVAAVMVIIIGGYTYVTSNGDAGKIKKARDTILYAVIGLTVALLAFAIVNFVLKDFFNGGKQETGTGVNSQKGGNDYSLCEGEDSDPDYCPTHNGAGDDAGVDEQEAGSGYTPEEAGSGVNSQEGGSGINPQESGSGVNSQESGSGWNQQ